MSDVPDWAAQFKAAADRCGEAMAQATRTLAAQEAMGWIMRGDMVRARKALDKVPLDKLDEVSAAAAALSSLAAEAANERAQ